jgi:hypothetical protein
MDSDSQFSHLLSSIINAKKPDSPLKESRASCCGQQIHLSSNLTCRVPAASLIHQVIEGAIIQHNPRDAVWGDRDTPCLPRQIAMHIFPRAIGQPAVDGALGGRGFLDYPGQIVAVGCDVVYHASSILPPRRRVNVEPPEGVILQDDPLSQS